MANFVSFSGENKKVIVNLDLVMRIIPHGTKVGGTFHFVDGSELAVNIPVE
jgi:hypothetical protein